MFASTVAAAASVDIAAPPALVMFILRDFPAYPQWAPFTERVDGALAPGAAVDVHVRLSPRDARTRRTRMRVLEATDERLAWAHEVGGACALLRAVRTQRVAPRGARGARYSTEDAFAGPLAPLARAACGGRVQAGLAAFAEALRARAEAAAAAEGGGGGGADFAQ